MTCMPTGPFDGGTWNDPTIINPVLINGKSTDLEASGLRITNNVVIDDAAAQALAKQLCPHIGDCLDITADDIAAVFKDCNGADHVAGAKVPTCEQMQQAIAGAVEPNVAAAIPVTSENTDVPTIIVGATRDQILGRPDAYLNFGGYLIPAYYPAPVNP